MVSGEWWCVVGGGNGGVYCRLICCSGCSADYGLSFTAFNLLYSIINCMHICSSTSNHPHYTASNPPHYTAHPTLLTIQHPTLLTMQHIQPSSLYSIQPSSLCSTSNHPHYAASNHPHYAASNHPHPGLCTGMTRCCRRRRRVSKEHISCHG
jgi:hypothetical protein